MKSQTSSTLSTIRAILRFPLIRIPLLGGILFVGMGISNGFMDTYKDTTLTALALVLLMVALALAVYWAFVRFVENRPVSELSTAPEEEQSSRWASLSASGSTRRRSLCCASWATTAPRG